MKILLLEEYPEIKVGYLDYLKKGNKILELSGKYDNSEVEVIIIRSNTKVNSKLLDQYMNLKFVARIGVGLDNIDLIECEKRGIKVLNTPGANADSVADLVLAGILNLSRKLDLGFEGLENRYEYMGFTFSKKVVSIIGFGNIGKKVYERLKSFGVKEFIIYDPFLSKEDVEKYEFCKKIEDKKEIFKKSDIISFHIPLLDSTRNFLGKKEIKSLKKDICIVNTSRGGIINENQMVEFLQENPESNLFMDVWEEEPNDPKIELLELENCLITPHIGAMTKEAEEKMHYFKELV